MRWARLAGVLCSAVLAGCVARGPSAVPPPAALVGGPEVATTLPAETGRCTMGAQDGPDGAAVVSPVDADKGASAAVPAPFQVADRGIGGTGGGDIAPPGGTAPIVPAPPARPTAPVDRGIGGTGIVGIITGFGSICVNGLEVAYDSTTPIAGEAGSVSPDGLRAGQLAVISASGGNGALHADQVDLRHEVIGPVESADSDGMLVVAGQSVRVTPDTRGIAAHGVGAWVAVSGLRDADQVVVATRIDPATPDRVGVHGLLTRDSHGVRIGALLLHVPRSLELPPESAVTASGHYLQGILYVDSILPDLLPSDPAALFAPATGDFFVESLVGLGFGGVDYDEVRFGGAPAVLRLRRQVDGSVKGVAALPAPAHYAPGPGGLRGRGAIMPPGGRFGATGHTLDGRRAVDRAGSSPAPMPDERARPAREGRGGGVAGGHFGGRGRRGMDGWGNGGPAPGGAPPGGAPGH